MPFSIRWEQNYQHLTRATCITTVSTMTSQIADKSTVDRETITTSHHFACLCEWNPPMVGGFCSQKASNAENVSMSWRHHVTLRDMTRGLIGNWLRLRVKIRPWGTRHRVVIFYFRILSMIYRFNWCLLQYCVIDNRVSKTLSCVTYARHTVFDCPCVSIDIWYDNELRCFYLSCCELRQTLFA